MSASRIEPALLDHPSRLFVETTSRCNLRCPMCVKQSGAGNVTDGDMAPEVFETLTQAFSHLDALILNGIGEPLLHPRLENWIRAGKAAMPAGSWVGFQSNGHLLDAARAQSLVEAGLDRIFLSVDATSPELFKAVRGGGNLGHIERALRALAAARQDHPGSVLEVGAEFVIMRDTLAELPGLVAWLAGRGVGRLVVSHILPFGPGMSEQPLFGINTAASEAFYRSWLHRARERHIDISQYFRVLWKLQKQPDDLRIVDQVQAITKQAAAKDIPFHIGNLIAGEDLTEAEGVFQKARDVAAAVGLDLALPALRPLSSHTCLGVRGGGMFVAWDGKVSPCHFLWRNCSCHPYGREKQVAHKVFGDLNEDDVTTIWNKPAYREFRSDVLRRRYPHCPACNVYPCEDINSPDFEYDCYGETVPCGDCLWSMGLLQCMGQEDEHGVFESQQQAEMAMVEDMFKAG